VTDDVSIYLILKALNYGTSKQLLRKRLENSPFPELRYISRQQYISIKGRVNFFFFEEEINLRRTTKYSGYVKHHTDQGSLRSGSDILAEVLDPFENCDEKLLFSYLTVGEFSLFGGAVLYPDENQKFETESKSKIKNGRKSPRKS